VTFFTSETSLSALGISSIQTQISKLICCEVVPVTVESGMAPRKLEIAPTLAAVAVGAGVVVGPCGVVGADSVDANVCTTWSQTTVDWFSRTRR